MYRQTLLKGIKVRSERKYEHGSEVASELKDSALAVWVSEV